MNAARNLNTGEFQVIDHRLADLEKDRDEASRRWARVETTLASIDKHLALGAQRMDAIDTHLESTDTTVEKLKDASGFGVPHLLGAGGFLTAIAAWVERFWNSTPTPPHGH